jgi:hypothetical protein
MFRAMAARCGKKKNNGTRAAGFGGEGKCFRAMAARCKRKKENNGTHTAGFGKEGKCL